MRQGLSISTSKPRAHQQPGAFQPVATSAPQYQHTLSTQGSWAHLHQVCSSCKNMRSANKAAAQKRSAHKAAGRTSTSSGLSISTYGDTPIPLPGTTATELRQKPAHLHQFGALNLHVRRHCPDYALPHRLHRHLVHAHAAGMQLEGRCGECTLHSAQRGRLCSSAALQSVAKSCGAAACKHHPTPA